MGRRGCRPRPCCRRRAQPPTDLARTHLSRASARSRAPTVVSAGTGARREGKGGAHSAAAWRRHQAVGRSPPARCSACLGPAPRQLTAHAPGRDPPRGGGAGRQVRTVAPCLVAGFAVFRHVVRPRAVLERALAAEARLGLLEALAVDGAADPRIPQRVQLAGGCCRGGLLSPSLAAPGAAGRGVHRAQPAAGAGRGRPISTRLG